ncbi:uncharacterized protein LOC131148129 [Malania oleifera]|uniref:uncharacterized protein LOC131148129 n=1 Tax=Malania oleifera TaxID=397392 RepID=UPI0025AE81D0|nr:uncharacterized protein LOC131148129 [Malania oleifera]
MKAEIATLELNDTWIIVDLPPAKEPICCKWVYKIKFLANGSQFDINNAFLHGDLEEEVYIELPPGYFNESGRKADYNLFTKVTEGFFIAILVYVDDIIVARNDMDTIDQLKRSLDDQFKIKDLGDSGTIGSTPAKISLDQNVRMSREEGELLPEPALYRRMDLGGSSANASGDDGVGPSRAGGGDLDAILHSVAQ